MTSAQMQPRLAPEERRRYRYTDEELERVKQAARTNDPDIARIVWDPILKHHHGKSLADFEGGDVVVRLSNYAIPIEQERAISRACPADGSWSWANIGPLFYEEE